MPENFLCFYLLLYYPLYYYSMSTIFSGLFALFAAARARSRQDASQETIICR